MAERPCLLPAKHQTASLYGVSHKYRAIGELLFGKIGKKEKLLQIMCFQVQALNLFLSRTSRYGATLFILSTVRSYGDVATLTWQRRRDVLRRHWMKEKNKETQEGTKKDWCFQVRVFHGCCAGLHNIKIQRTFIPFYLNFSFLITSTKICLKLTNFNLQFTLTFSSIC
jgi:hypothetical protein